MKTKPSPAVVTLDLASLDRVTGGCRLAPIAIKPLHPSGAAKRGGIGGMPSSEGGLPGVQVADPELSAGLAGLLDGTELGTDLVASGGDWTSGDPSFGDCTDGHADTSHDPSDPTGHDGDATGHDGDTIGAPGHPGGHELALGLGLELLATDAHATAGVVRDHRAAAITDHRATDVRDHREPASAASQVVSLVEHVSATGGAPGSLPLVRR